MKILIASDSHDRWGNLENAINKGNKTECEIMLFAGDFMSPPGINVLEQFNGAVHFVFGNNDGELVGLTQMISASKKITLHYQSGESTLRETFGDLSFFMNHYPNVVRNAAQTNEYDVCIYGHDHLYHEETLANGTLLLNPGELQGYRTGNITCMILDTETLNIEKVKIGP